MYKIYTALILSLFAITVFAETPFLPPDAPWPTIHKSPKGTKEGSYKGPLVRAQIRESATSQIPILMTLSHRFLYVQMAGDTKIYAYDPANLKRGILYTGDIGATYPVAGGGALDQFDQTWWTNGTRIVRFSPTLSQKVYSESLFDRLTPAEQAEFKVQPMKMNSVDFLPDGRVLVGTMSPWLFLVDSTPAGGEFPFREKIAKTDFTSRGRGIVSRREGYGPRPILYAKDGRQFVFLNTSSHLLKIEYDLVRRTFVREVAWAFRNPDNLYAGPLVTSEVLDERSDLSLSNPVIVRNQVCVATQPGRLQRNLRMKVHCLDIDSGALMTQFEPFSEPGVSALHTLGAIESQGRLFVIGQSSKAEGGAGDGGVMAYDLASRRQIWKVLLNDVSASFVVSAPSSRLYLTSKASNAVRLSAIDTNTGARYDLESNPSLLKPYPSLGAVGPAGLYFPTTNGFKRYADESIAMDWVNDAYRILLGRGADPGGLQGWTGQLTGGRAYQDVMASIAGSMEYFQRKGGTNEGFIEGLYRDILRRAPDAPGFAAWVNELRRGASRESVARGFLYSIEFTGLLR